jgi:hypothetical protein
MGGVSACSAALTAAADNDEIDYCCAYATKGAYKASMDSPEEKAWQEARLGKKHGLLPIYWVALDASALAGCCITRQCSGPTRWEAAR